jgi:hypothetical protein
VKEILILSEIDGRRSRWIAKILKFDLEIKPTKLIKGQGLAILLAKCNCKSLGVMFTNECSQNQKAKPYDTNAQADPPLAGCPWYKDVIYFLQALRPPDGIQRNKQRDLKLKDIIYYLVGKYLYWKDPVGVLLRCLDPHESQSIMSDFHDSSCGGNHFWKMTAHNILRASYFCPTLFNDVFTKVRACAKCHKFSRKQQLKPLPLKLVIASGPFQQWGLDFIGEVHPAYDSQHRWILMATYYFTKLIEAIPIRSASH